jgi:CheY-like chemotaxis protein
MPTQPLPPGHKALILAVERDPYVRTLERYFLEQAGFRVEFVDNGEEALEQAHLLHPDILVAEILVPRMDGLSVCRALKADPATHDIAVVIFSILAAEDRAREAGADAFLRKPLDDRQLTRCVEELLAKRTARETTLHGTN